MSLILELDGTHRLVGSLKKILYQAIPKRHSTVMLGRWTMENCQTKTNIKIDSSNEDHCGVCKNGMSYVVEDFKQRNTEEDEYIRYFMV